MQPTNAGGGAVTANEGKTRSIQIAMAVAALVGIGVVAAGFWLGGVLTLGGLGGLISMHFVGGAGTASCPSCGDSFPVMQVKRRRVAPCRNCGVWLAGAHRMEAVLADALEKRPTFTTALPQTFVWRQQCANCEAPAVKTIEIASMPKRGVVLPVATVIKAQVPLCERHGDQHTNVWIHQSRSGATISFRSLGAMLRFSNDNGLGPEKSAAAFWEDTEAAQPLQ